MMAMPSMASDVHARLKFIVDTGVMPVAASVGPSGQIDHRGTYEDREVVLRDVRGESTSIDVEGFTLVEHPTAVSDFHDSTALAKVYDAEVAALLRSVTGARRVEAFDHTIRTADEQEQSAKSLREPLAVAHNDYTETSGLERLRRALPAEADALLKRRFAIIQVWRATHDPIHQRPLAVCDAQTVRSQDLLLTERRHRDRTGYIYHLLYRDAHRWCWFPTMTRNEALVFKVFDSEEGRARFTPHGSPVLTDSPAGAGPRRSIETRAFVFF